MHGEIIASITLADLPTLTPYSRQDDAPSPQAFKMSSYICTYTGENNPSQVVKDDLGYLANFRKTTATTQTTQRAEQIAAAGYDGAFLGPRKQTAVLELISCREDAVFWQASLPACYPVAS